MQCEIQIYVICIFKFIVKCTNSQNNCYGKISKLELAIIVNSQTQMMFHPFLLPFSLHSSLLPLTLDLPPPLATKSSQTQNNKIQIEKIYSKPLPHRNPQTPHDKSTLYRNPPPPPLTTKPKKKKKTPTNATTATTKWHISLPPCIELLWLRVEWKSDDVCSSDLLFCFRFRVWGIRWYFDIYIYIYICV